MNPAQTIDRLAGRFFGLKYYEHQVARELRRHEEQPILVWQMGKVGSTSIEEAVLQAPGRAPFFRTHLLSPEMIVRGETYRRAQNRGTREYLRSDAIRAALLNSRHGWRIVTVVREPMSRNLSAFFQNLDVYFGRDARKRLDSLEFPRAVSLLAENFVEQFDHDRPAEWFDHEIRGLLGVDVLELPFDTELGAATYCAGSHSLLVLRVESLAQSGEGALADFLGMPGLVLGRHNDGEAKWYSSYYRQLRLEHPLPKQLLDRVYGSRYARRFYSPDELLRYRDMWSNN